MNHIKGICFDLDDTLWDLGPVIENAEDGTYRWLSRNFPRTTEHFSIEDMRDLRVQIAREFKHSAHDLSFLRRKTFSRIAAVAGYGEDMVEPAFQTFQSFRNTVELYADVLPVLEELRQRYRLLALTNGNADLEVIGLVDFFDHVFSASQLGIAKPDVAVFHEICTRSNLQPDELIHAGNDPEHDIIAAGRTGMITVWVNRNRQNWPNLSPEPDFEVRNLEGLLKLLNP